jgi:hypothetical protein
MQQRLSAIPFVPFCSNSTELRVDRSVGMLVCQCSSVWKITLQMKGMLPFLLATASCKRQNPGKKLPYTFIPEIPFCVFNILSRHGPKLLLHLYQLLLQICTPHV